ncbi:MAG TPA: aminodeoxychorismate synthase component I [Flavobacteriales bacterium]|nr:aminodeoxychorismate synthase component I [Flavobacteriales bacterium]
MDAATFQALFTRYLTGGQPFLFLLDFEGRAPFLCRTEEALAHGIAFDVKGMRNTAPRAVHKPVQLTARPIAPADYAARFRNVKEHLDHGNTYLLNLTFPTPIAVNLGLEEIFHLARAPYKLLWRDRFVVFSPESFIRTSGHEVYTYPMKGTIDAAAPNAEATLLANRKEEWEHNTIVDLMRNDLAMLAGDITVTRYRYVERIRTHRGELLQTSSEIRGRLKPGWQSTFCADLLRMLPAGSISGAPKQKTLEIIAANETAPRGYYTGIFGLFNGQDIDSAVCIRFIEQRDGRTWFRSGGGITANSVLEDEYRELVQKIYVPVGEGGDSLG